MNTNYEKEFVLYEQALALKELGFDEPFKIFDQAIVFRNKGICMANEYALEYFDFYGDEVISAPLKQQVFRWFREKYELRNSITDFIEDETGIEWDYEIAIIGTDIDERGNYKPLIDYSTDDETRKFKTYEEAELACINKLIEIVKQQL